MPGRGERQVYRSLEELTVRSEDGGFVSRWAAFYRVLQGELTYQRRVKRGESCAAPNERDAAVAQTVTAAVNAKDPLEGRAGCCSRWNLTGWMSWWDCTASTTARSTATR